MERLRLSLIKAGIRQIDLAVKTGIPAAHISRCANHPSLYKFTDKQKKEIANILDVDRIWLFESNTNASSIILDLIPSNKGAAK